ncbi:MAG: DUF1549 and DUF1553 domain-containing protein [Isosphaeraceae bacterium]
MTRALWFLAVMCLPVLVFAANPKPSDDAVAPPETFSADQRAHWSYQVPKRSEPPEVKDQTWIKNPIDRFILAGIEDMDFVHAPEADRVALIRRVTFDLIGLPPTPTEVDAFLNDDQPNAYERLVDRLLSSPQYGERWAQHWLDLAHYADSNGFELDVERPDAWRYRDWVVKALNDDLPYDRFLTLQLAGDELEPGNPDALIATGFNRCGPRELVGGNIDPAVKRQSELTEVTGTVGSVFLGMTLVCARCHDHKFDPVPTTDYYRLQSFFAKSELIDQPIATKAETEAFAAAKKAVDAKIAPLRQAMAALEAPYRTTLRDQKQTMLTEAEQAVLTIPEKDRTPVQKKLAAGANKALQITWEEVAKAVSSHPEDHTERERLKQAIHDVQVTLPPPPPKAMALIDQASYTGETFVLRRGEVTNRGVRVAPRPPGVLLASQGSDAFSAEAEVDPNRRLALARWLTRADNPVTARVIVNRLWMHHIGRGIVATPNDFGIRGEDPSHPELLDWLATELLAQGWRLKPIHRLIVTSATYRQASRFSMPTQTEDDPDNSLVWKMNRRRLEAESLRDAMLAVTGELNPKMGGPGVLVPIEKEVEALIFTEAEVVDLWPETPDPAEHARRSLYLFRKRNVRYPMFDAFDAPDTQTACARRAVSTHALQPLVLLNSAFAIDRAKALAGRLIREAGDDPRDQVLHAYRIVLARPPSPEESLRALAFLSAQSTLLHDLAQDGQPLAQPVDATVKSNAARAAALVDFALAMMNRNEFVYVP